MFPTLLNCIVLLRLFRAFQRDTPSHYSLGDCELVFAKSSKMLPSTLPWNLRVFKENLQSTFDISIIINLELIQIFLENIALVLTLNFEDFQGSTLKNLDHKITCIKVLENPWWTGYLLSANDVTKWIMGEFQGATVGARAGEGRK